MQKQVIIIHGGDTFNSYEDYLKFLKNYEIGDLEYFRKKKWKDSMPQTLGDNYDVLMPQMPNKINAKYSEWKIWFEKLVPLLNNEVILVGHSLGGIFLTKYLSENNFPKKILGLFLISAPFDEKDIGESLADFRLPLSLSNLQGQCAKIFVYHSHDDPIVPFVDLEKYRKALPQAKFIVLDVRGHFNQSEFPELIKDIKSL